MTITGIPLDKAKDCIQDMIGHLKIIAQANILHVAELQDSRILIRELEEVLRILPIDTDEHETG